MIARASAPRHLPARPPHPLFNETPPSHLAWVWQFRHDGDLAAIRDVLALYGLGIMLKTHDGTSWMSRFDPSPDAVSGPEQVETLATYFEDGGVPFHCWCVVHGEEPLEEAAMAASVLSAGARSLAVDLEAHPGFWRGTSDTASQYGDELRRQQPDAPIVTTVDARPWEVDRVPLTEFSAFTDALAPQVYWSAFGTAANLAKFKRAGDDPGDDGMTPKFALNSAYRALERFQRPLLPIGDGSVDDETAWREFVDASYERDAEAVSVWRFGVTSPTVWKLLQELPPRIPTYTVVAGDTLGDLAMRWGTTVDAIVGANGLADPNLLSIGQVLQVPRGVRLDPALSGATAGTAAPPAAATTSGGTYEVEEGDSLWYLAEQWGTTPEAIGSLNGVDDPALLQIGQVLRIP